MIPRVTIGVPVYQSRAGWLEAAFHSLLAQRYGDFELVLSDNASDDEHAERYRALAALDSRVRLVRHERSLGAPGNFNFLIDEARAPYFCWAADDDLHEPDYLDAEVALLDGHHEAVGAGCRVAFIDDDDRFTAEARLGPRAAANTPAARAPAVVEPDQYVDIYALFRTDALRRTRRVLPLPGADHVLLLELLLQGPIVRADELLFRYRRQSTHSATYRAELLTGERQVDDQMRRQFRDLSRRLLETAYHAAHLPPVDRAAACAALALALGAAGWLTADHLAYASRNLRAAVAERDLASAARWALPYAALRGGGFVGDLLVRLGGEGVARRATGGSGAAH